MLQANRALAFLTINMCTLPIQELKTGTEVDLSGKGRLGIKDAVIVVRCIQVYRTTFLIYIAC